MTGVSWTDVHSLETSSSTADQFWAAVKIWNERPHIVNRRLLAVESLVKFKLKNAEVEDDDVCRLIGQIIVTIGTSRSESAYESSNLENVLRNFPEVEILDNNCDENIVNSSGRDGEVNNIVDENHLDFGVYCEIKKLLPRMHTESHFDVEMSMLDMKNDCATFIKFYSSDLKCSISPDYKYRLKYTKGLFVLSIEDVSLTDENTVLSDGDGSKKPTNCDFLKHKLMPKLVKWAENVSPDTAGKSSLRLVPVHQYCMTYSKLKSVYGKMFVEIWPERTDPLKYVYEDIAIATYLILLWKEKKQRFVDLGCGNGLLVFILNSEGHQGYGIDVRPRKIWQMYPSIGGDKGPLDLRIGTVTPSELNVYPDSDWLIGNHSDELTPWIPVFAAKSSYHCKFFLLPCCPYEFNGEKYQRKNSSSSRYMEYLDYIKTICEKCGFNTSTDKMRIPSTKRICIVGSSRNYDKDCEGTVHKEIDDLVKSKCTIEDSSGINNSGSKGGLEKEPALNFKPRSNVEKVTNCTQLGKDFTDTVVSFIAKQLLNGAESKRCDISQREWNAGSSLTLRDLAERIPKEYLMRLKSEGKGLQTLIRNHHHMFVINEGKVVLRKPVPCADKGGRDLKPFLRTRPCWFYSNHPDSCPLEDFQCRFLHASVGSIT